MPKAVSKGVKKMKKLQLRRHARRLIWFSPITGEIMEWYELGAVLKYLRWAWKQEAQNGYF